MVDRLNLYDSTIKINKINCDKITNTEFQNYYFGPFQCNKSLNTNPAMDIPIFSFTTAIPHYQRSIRADIIYMYSGDSKATVTIKSDDQAQTVVQVNSSNNNIQYTRLQVDCTQNPDKSYNEDLDQFYRGSWTYLKQSSNVIKLAFDSTCPEDYNISQFRISGIQVNINPCHPSCQSCDGPLESNCLSCAISQGASGPVKGKCTCNDPTSVFQFGICQKSCDSTKFLFENNKICILIPNCLQNIDSQCQKCKIGFYLADGQCFIDCPAGYQQMPNNICQYKNANLIGKKYISGLLQRDFSMISVANLGVVMSNYLQQNSQTSLYSRCNQINFLGGFFINQMNSTITFPEITNVYKQVSVSFQYIFVDYETSGNSGVFVEVIVGSQSVKSEIQTDSSSSSNICGLSKKDIVGFYSNNFQLPKSSNFIIKITNSNKSSNINSSSSSRNAHAYFGMREIDVFGFDCSVDFCSSCSGATCSQCIDGYYLQANSCQKCGALCATCNSSAECKSCKPKFVLNPQKQCVCNDGYYFSNNDCLLCTNNLCKTCLSSAPLTCTSCYTNKVLALNGQCLDKCLPAQYVDTNNSCQNCLNKNCFTCDPLKSSKCLTCKDPYFLINDNCESKCPEKYYENIGTRQCQACQDPTCKKCNPFPDNKCTDCYSPLILQSGKCQAACDYGYYQDPLAQKCLICSGICKECKPENPSYCMSCYAPLVMKDGVCSSQCGKGQYIDQDNNCQACLNSKCLSCDPNQTDQCLNCGEGYYFYMNDCVTDCPALGTYKSEADRQCKSCPDSNCLSCDSNDPSICSKCKNPTGLLGNSCVLDCGDGKYVNTSDQMCTDCQDINCKICDPNTPSSCLKCLPPFGLLGSACVSDCGDKYYLDQDLICQECSNKTCKTCADNDSQVCLSCFSDKVLHDSSCKDKCPDNFYQSPHNNICSKCPDQNCKKCSADLTQNDCQSCFQPYVLQGSVCILNCNDGYYIDSNQICQKCNNNNCQHCDQSDSNICLSCDSSKVLHQEDCIDNCPSGYYKNSVTGQCLLCISNNCDVCDSNIPDLCLNCKPTYLIQDGQCVQNCSDNYYVQGQQCLSCENNNCLTCDPNDSKNCLTCSEDKEIYLNDCVSKCKESEIYDQVGKKCIKCLNDCLQCEPSDPSICTACSPPNVLSNSQCKLECDEGMHIDISQNKCINCLNPLCSSCNPFQSNECFSCKNPKILLGINCVDKCENNMYIDSTNNSCQICSNPQQNCQTCLESNPSFCIQCEAPFALLGNDCVLDCGDGFAKNSVTNTCDKCINKDCKNCDPLNKNECISCQPPLALLETSKQCLRYCPNGMYIDTILNICQDCSNSSCKTCLETSSDKCLSCETPLHLQNSQCIAQCDKGYYLDIQLNECRLCQNPGSICLTCDPMQPQKCKSCESPKALWQGNCVDSCDDGYVIDTNNQICVKCLNSNCLTCSFPDTQKCLSCENQKFLDLNDCLDRCLPGMYFDVIKSVCQTCQNNKCEQCDPSNSIHCITCKSPKIKKGYDCVDSCGENMFVDLQSNSCKSCSNKNNNCLTCSIPPNENVCTSCKDPYALLNSDCVIDCGLGKVKNPISNICEDCSNKNCLTCSLSKKDQCLTCPNNLYLLNGDCVKSCGDNMFEENNVCLPCLETSCKKCLANSPICTSCSAPKYLYQGKCLDECGDSWYKGQLDQNCYQCNNIECKTCDRNDSNICLSCIHPKILDEKDCVDYCGENKFFDTQTNQCQPCNKNCKECKDNQRCLKCQAGYFENNGICVSKCPQEKFYENKNEFKCVSCSDINCTDCSNDNNMCKKCRPGYYITKQNSNLQMCEKCLNKDCQNVQTSSIQYPQSNEILQQSMNAFFTVLSISAGILSPFYMLVSFFDLLQVTNYLLFINANYSSNLYTFFQLFNFANFEIIPNIKSSNSNAPYKFRHESIDTFLFSNLIQVFTIWVTSLIMYAVSKLAKPSGTSLIFQLMNYYRNNYKYNIIIGLGFLTYCDITLSVFLQLYDLENMQTLQILGLICSIGFICLLFGLNAMTFYVTQKNNYNIHLKQYDRFFNEGFNRKKSIINLIFLLRKTVIIFILVFKQVSPIYQGLQIFLILGFETTIMLAIKPFKVDKEYKLNILGRALLLLSLILIVCLSFDDGMNNLSDMSRSFIEIVIMLSLSVLFVSQIGYLFYSVFKKRNVFNKLNLVKQQNKI
ncbi:hypothetical protein ABPG74_004066 [Tetrahymena malaccensis]